MEIEEEGGIDDEGEKWVGSTKRALGALDLLTKDAEPSRTSLVDAFNGFNDLSRLEMLWTVQRLWPVGAMFTFSCYRHWAQLLLHQTVEPLVTILSIEGVTQGYPLSLVL